MTGRSYWEGYSNLQKVKHTLIRDYLGGWFPKLGSWAGEVVYIETHAGRGRHRTGEPGSPLVAVNALLEHRYLKTLLARSQARFILIEKNLEDSSALQSEIRGLGALPPRVTVEVHKGAFEDVLAKRLSALQAVGGDVSPSFVFVDPFGFKMPYETLRQLMALGRLEIFVNVIWRELDMAIRTAKDKPGLAETLDWMFEGRDWQKAIVGRDSETRAAQTVDLVRERAGARWATHVIMRGGNRAIRYLLVHLTNHSSGRNLMKAVMWKVCRVERARTFVAYRSDDPDQLALLREEPDLRPLTQWVTSTLESGPRRWKDLEVLVVDTIWLGKHLNEVVGNLRRSGLIMGTSYSGRFSPTANPLLSLARHG